MFLPVQTKLTIGRKKLKWNKKIKKASLKHLKQYFYIYGLLYNAIVKQKTVPYFYRNNQLFTAIIVKGFLKKNYPPYFFANRYCLTANHQKMVLIVKGLLHRLKV